MNVVAGIIIGIVNSSWVAIILAPLGWGIVWCIYQYILQDRLKNYIKNAEAQNTPKKWGLNYAQAFYFIEYFTAVTTALFFSIITKVIKIFL